MEAWFLAALVLSLLFWLIVVRALFGIGVNPPDLRVFLLQLFLIPAAGFTFYTLTLSSPPQPSWLVWPASALMLVAVALGIRNSRTKRKVRSGVITYKMLDAQSLLALAVRVSAVAGMSGYLFIFEPVFATVNVVANATWALAWVTRRLREVHVEAFRQLDAEPERVWALVADPINWPKWQVDIADVSAHPSGAVAVGTEFVSHSIRSLTDAAVVTIECRWVITEVVSGRSFTRVSLDFDAKTILDLQNAGGGTRIGVRSDLAISVIDGILGAGFHRSAAKQRFHSDSVRNFARLGDLVSESPTPTPS